MSGWSSAGDSREQLLCYWFAREGTTVTTGASDPLTRCGIDTVEIARIERLLCETPTDDLIKIFSSEELRDYGDNGGRTASGRAAGLAARFAAKEACLKLFPREAAMGTIGPADFAVARDGYGAPRIVCSANALELLDRYRLKTIALSLTHDKCSASAVAVTEPVRIDVPVIGRLVYYLLPIRRRVVLSNLYRVFGCTVPAAEIKSLAQAHYAHLARVLLEFLSHAWRRPTVRVDNIEAILRAHAQGKGVLVLTGHFGNWEVATLGGIASFPQYRGQFHFVRRALHPRWLDRLVTRRFRRGGFGVLPKRGALDAILGRLAAGDAVVFVLDQHAGGRDGVEVDFFGYPAGTFRSLAILALATGAPVVPTATWREPDGSHVLRFEEALRVIEHEDANEAIRTNTRAYNVALERLVLRHPEQWFWVHRRWKPTP
jgi:KDO2-lipid IV(A) lauroyltransferase